MRYLLDSNALIDYYNKLEPASSLVQSLLSQHEVGISIITITEVRTGWNQAQADYYLPLVYNMFTLEEVSREIAELAGAWRNHYRGHGKKLSTPDVLIAATAHLKAYCLVTRDQSGFPMPELDVYRDLFS